MATDITTQFVREAPEIEAQKLGLLQSSKALVDAANKAAMEGRYLTPSYQIAGFSPDQVQAIEAARTGIGAYQPYMATATQQSMDAARGFNRAMQVLQGADTRGQFGRAQEEMRRSGVPISQLGTAAQLASQGTPLIGQGAQDLAAAQNMAARYQQADLNAPQELMGRSVGLMGAAGPQFGQASSLVGTGLGQGQFAAEQAAQAAGQQPAFQQGIGALYSAAGQAQRAAQLGAAPTVDYAPNLAMFQMGPAERVRTQSFAQPGAAEALMSPYMQNVVERQQQAAQREADIQKQTLGAQFAQAGAFGGGRFGVQQARMAEALARQKGDIQAQGLQSAFQQAQQQFNQEQQARLAAQQANQQAGLTVGGQNLQAALGVQQLGAQQGLQSALANQAMQGQYGLAGAQYGLQAADALRQAGLGQMSGAGQLGQLGLAAAQQQAQAGQMSLQGAQQLASQEAQRSQAAQEAARYMGNIGQTLGQQELQQAQLGQAAAGQIGQLGAQRAGLAGLYGQVGAQQANILGQQAGLQQALGQGIGTLAGQEFGIGAQMAQGIGGLAGQQAGLAGQIAGMGAQQQALGQQDVNFLYNIGAQQQRQQQAILDARRQNQLQQNMQPFQQIGFLSDIYKGAPSTQMAMTQQNQAAPSPFQQIAGLGIAGVSAAAAGAKAGIL